MDELIIRPWHDLEAQQRSLTAYLELLMQMARNAPSLPAFEVVADRIERVLMAADELDALREARRAELTCPAPECRQRFDSLLELRRHVEDTHFAPLENGE